MNPLRGAAICCAVMASAGIATAAAHSHGGGAGAVPRGAPVSAVAAGDGLAARAASHRRRPPKRGRVTQIGDSPCQQTFVTEPTVDFDVTRLVGEFRQPPAFELGVPFSICFGGFDPSQAIDAEVTLPNGSQRRGRIEPSDSGSLPRPWQFFAYPPDPVGDYQVKAAQGSSTAAGTFTIVRPTGPKLELLRYEIAAGGSVPVALSGFDPRESIALYLYRSTGYSQGGEEVSTRSYARVARVATFRVDARGFARRRVVVRRPGNYLLSAGGLFNSGFGFEVVRR